MFGPRRRRAPVAPRGQVAAGVHAEAVAVAAPDWAGINRDRALREVIGRTLQGHSGQIIDYDRGDPEHSYTRVVQPFQNPTESLARLGMRDGVTLYQSEVYDVGTSDEQLTAYQAATLARISR